MQVDDRVGSPCSIDERIDDDDVGDTRMDRGSQLFPCPDGDQGVLRAQNDFEVRQELTGQESDEIHAIPGRMS
jgi:hypothetical protein